MPRRACRSVCRPWRPGRRLRGGARRLCLERIEVHAPSAERLHGDDFTPPVLAQGKTDTALMDDVRFPQPSGGPAPPAAVFYYSRDRGLVSIPQAHLANQKTPEFSRPTRIAATASLMKPGRSPGPIFDQRPVGFYARRPFFVMADLAENARRTPQGKKPSAISRPWRWKRSA